MCSGGMMGMGLGILVWFVVGLALIVLAVLGSIWLVRNMSHSARRSTPLDELERRYASGELDHEEFMRRREDLSTR